ncbi:MAG: hypothetical protein LV481_05765 [Methylacidiphilales bacterium]|nr:hypothetical protein [Candidatus Methylacidiphilales bacterium]
MLAKDSVHPLADIPQSSVGAPCPMAVADDHHLSVIYYVQNTPENWDGTSVRSVGPTTEGEPYAIVSFVRYDSYYHGSPNDEAFSGHPLSKRGLTPYGAFEIKHSTWIRQLMEMNRVHPYHKDENFSACRHFVLSFHDSTFECVARSYSFKTGSGSILSAARTVFDDWE